MDAVITYDIKSGASKDTAVKNGMKAIGYLDHFVTQENGRQVTYTLPNTTLWRNNTSPLQAKNDLQAVARSCNADIERLLATEITANWVAIPGKPYEN